MDSKAQCVCPTCSNIPRPVCATDGVQDLNECHLRRQACQGDILVAIAKQGTCGMMIIHSVIYSFMVTYFLVFILEETWILMWTLLERH